MRTVRIEGKECGRRGSHFLYIYIYTYTYHCGGSSLTGSKGPDSAVKVDVKGPDGALLVVQWTQRQWKELRKAAESNLCHRKTIGNPWENGGLMMINDD